MIVKHVGDIEIRETDDGQLDEVVVHRNDVLFGQYHYYIHLLRRNRMVHTQAGKHSLLAMVTPAPVVTISVWQTANFFLYPKKPLGCLY